MSEEIIQLLISERDRLQAAIDALKSVPAPVSDPPDWVTGKTSTPTAPEKKGFSAATRRKMAEGQKRRWAAINAAKTESTAPTKRTMSAEGRQRIIDATKARWAKVRAAKAVATAPKKAPSKKSAIIAAITPSAEETEFKAKMSAAMKKAWAKRKKAAKKKG
jgi:hypothetical protein